MPARVKVFFPSRDSSGRLEMISPELPALLAKSVRYQEISSSPSKKVSCYLVHIVLHKIIKRTI